MKLKEIYMEIVLQHTNVIYRNFFIGAVVTIIITSIPAIAKLIKCRYEFAEYKLKDKLLWIVPVIFFLIAFLNAGLYMIDYTFERTDIQTVYIENVRGYNAGCYLYSENQKFRANSKDYDSEIDVLYVMKDEVEGHWCEIESYKTWNNVIRVKVLD